MIATHGTLPPPALPAPADTRARTPGQVQATIARAKAKRARKALRNMRNEKRAARGAVAAGKRAPRTRKAPAAK